MIPSNSILHHQNCNQFTLQSANKQLITADIATVNTHRLVINHILQLFEQRHNFIDFINLNLMLVI